MSIWNAVIPLSLPATCNKIWLVRRLKDASSTILTLLTHFQRPNSEYNTSHTFRSMSPEASSAPVISESISGLPSPPNSCVSRTKPIAIPATGNFIGTPASWSAKQPPQTEAMLVMYQGKNNKQLKRVIKSAFVNCKEQRKRPLVKCVRNTGGRSGKPGPRTFFFVSKPRNVNFCRVAESIYVTPKQTSGNRT